MTALAARVHAEYREMPGLRLTVWQAARLFGVGADVAAAVLDELQRASVLARSRDGVFSLLGGAMSTHVDTAAAVPGSLRDASLDRLACLLRHWTWADEAMNTFDRELAAGWDEADDPLSDRPFGAYHHWCALLCALGEAALGQGLLPASQLESIRSDIDASLPGLQACRQRLIVIPASLEEHPRIVDVLRDVETVARLRRVHQAFGDAIRDEHLSRQIASLDQ